MFARLLHNRALLEAMPGLLYMAVTWEIALGKQHFGVHESSKHCLIAPVDGNRSISWVYQHDLCILLMATLQVIPKARNYKTAFSLLVG
jgi:hypothetical protein